jgi:vacuolar-type H+-ATPase subunit E/Vma4
MALADLLRVIEADAAAERARADRESALEAAAIVERARREARALAAELAAAPEPAARADAERTRALARLDAARAIRGEREDAFSSLLTGVRSELGALRASEGYPALFRALLAEARAALPAAAELRVDRRDLDLATPLARGLRVDPTLDTCGGIELASDDGRIIRNTVEERLANADLLLRSRSVHRLATTNELEPVGMR